MADRVSTFNQGGYQTDLSSNGVCKGACLDWIRRALSAGKLTYAYTHDSVKGQKRLGVMARTHAVVNAEVRKKTEVFGKAAKVSEEFDSKVEWKQSIIGDLLFWIDPVDEIRKQQNQTLKPVLEESEKISQTGMIEHCWNDIVLHWNQVVKSSKTTDGVKVKNLSNLSAWGIAPIPFTDLEDTLGKLFALNNFRPDTCLFLEVMFARGGHAIAIYKNSDTTFTFFDPNYGIYSLSSYKKLMAVFLYLLQTGYPSLGYHAAKLGVVVFHA